MSENIEKRDGGGALAGIGGKVVAVGVLAIAAYVLFKLVIGIVTTIAWVALVIVAVVAGLWALNKLF